MTVTTPPPLRRSDPAGAPPPRAPPRCKRSDRTVLALGLAAVVLALATAAAGLGPLALPVSVAALVVAGGALAIVVRQRQREAAGRERFSVVLGTLDDAPVGHLVTNSGGAVVYANPAARALFGSARVERLDDVERLLGADEGQRATLRRLHDDAGDGAPDITELAHTDAGGDSWWRVSARPLDDLDGHVHWQFEDVTERRAHEASLRRQQATLIDFMNQAPVGFYSVDQDGRFLFANATLAAWLGVAPERLLDGTYRLQDFLVSFPAHVPPHGTAGDRAESVAFEAVMRDRNGRLFQASIAQTVVPGDDGRTTTRSLVRDLTPERQIREALRASEARFQRFFDDAPIGIALADHASCLTEWNSAFEQLVGEAGDDLAGRPIAQVLTERNPGIIDGRLSAVLAGEDIEGPLDVLVRGRRGDLSLLLFAKRLENGPGEPAGLILQFIDQTEQQKLEAQFTQSQKMQAVGQLAGGIAHDFNNLLTAMIGFCDLLLLRHKPGDPSFGDLMQVKQNANRAANLVRQLLAFSRQQTLQPRVLNVTDALADLSNLLRRLIGENIELKMVHGRDLGLVKVDQGQLEQVIINLAVNARDAMPNGGRLTITTANVTITAPIRRGSEEMPPGDYVSIEVADSGVGIPPEYLDRIFDPFFSTKEVGSGTGLGLSTVYGIVRQTGGYVFVESGPGRGASFAIHLPLHREPEAGRTGEAEAHDRSFRDLTGIGRILLVEDEDPVRVFSARALRNKGYDVLEARSGEEALEHIAADEAGIDLLITDVVMPKMDGPTLIRRVREIRPEMRVICISGYTEDRFRQHLDGEDTHFLAKPFSLKQLATKVKDVMREGVA